MIWKSFEGALEARAEHDLPPNVVREAEPGPSSPKLVPTPQFLPPGSSSSSCASQCFLSPGEIPEVGGGDTCFGFPKVVDLVWVLMLAGVTGQTCMLYYTILYYTILYYIILYYTILYYTVMYYSMIYYNILYYTIIL